MAQQYGLGRGLASLIPPKKNDNKESEQVSTKTVFTYEHAISEDRERQVLADEQKIPQNTKSTRGGEKIALTQIVPNPHQPRTNFDETKLAELVDSIREHGILQPLVVSQIGDRYELIAGERRFQAAKRAGLSEVPVVVRVASEQDKLELAIIENIQRHNLNPIEEAKAYQRLLHEFGLSQEEVAQKMGKKRSTVANSVRLLQLPIDIQRAVIEGKISEGHAKALLAIENREKQRAVFEMILNEELTVRETENKAKSVTVKSHIRAVNPEQAALNARAEELTELFGTKVKIARSGKGGRVVIEYYSEEELQALLQKMLEKGNEN